VKDQTQRAGSTIHDAVQENPLAVGAVALAIGAAVGLAVPVTRRENQLMGEARDRLVDQVQASAGEAVETAQRVASQAVEEVTGGSGGQRQPQPTGGR
jgi:hypothetical protein